MANHREEKWILKKLMNIFSIRKRFEFYAINLVYLYMYFRWVMFSMTSFLLAEMLNLSFVGMNIFKTVLIPKVLVILWLDKVVINRDISLQAWLSRWSMCWSKCYCWSGKRHYIIFINGNSLCYNTLEIICVGLAYMTIILLLWVLVMT